MASTLSLLSEVFSPSAVSFETHKINFNKCLGEGVVGTVYEVVRRPANENGWIASLSPYVYDRIYPVDEAKKIETDLCVKISKTTLGIFLRTPCFILRQPLFAFYESQEERELNGMLQRLGATSIKFYDTDGYYAQFKTRVYGHNFAHHLRERSFLDPARFEFRKAFVTLLRTVSLPEFDVDDIHANNLMYDERKKLWEIVDGNPGGFGLSDASEKSRMATFLSWATIVPPKGNRVPESRDERLRMLFEKLSQAAIDRTDYTLEIDKELLSSLDGELQRKDSNRKFFASLSRLSMDEINCIFETVHRYSSSDKRLESHSAI